MSNFKRKFLTLVAEESSETLRGIASPARVRILKLLRVQGPLNVNEISDALDLPQSTIATHVQVLERSGLIETETDRKSTRLNSSHANISYAVFCLKKITR